MRGSRCTAGAARPSRACADRPVHRRARGRSSVLILRSVLDLSARAAVITGATGNLGHAVVRAFLERGAHVAIPVRDDTKDRELRTAVGDLAGTPDEPRLISRRADLAERADMEAFVEHVMRAWGRLDILANLAGGFAGGSALDIASIQALWDQNVRGTVTATAACVTPMRARRYGRIVTVGSMSALKARKGAAGYAMAK